MMEIRSGGGGGIRCKKPQCQKKKIEKRNPMLYTSRKLVIQAILMVVSFLPLLIRYSAYPLRFLSFLPFPPFHHAPHAPRH